MLSDRLYMREPETRGKVSVLTWLICAITAGFILQNAFLRWLQLGNSLEAVFGLSPAALHAGRVWTLVTYSFLHSPDNLLHIACNLLALYFIGRELLPLLGARRFLSLYAAAVVIEQFEEPEPIKLNKQGKPIRSPLTRIAAAIYCERDGQKAILIGKGGSKLKEIGTGARRQIESLLGTRVYLELHVIVEPGWRESKHFVESLNWRNQLERLAEDQIEEIPADVDAK